MSLPEPPSPVFTLKGSMKPVHSLMYDFRTCTTTGDAIVIIYAGTQDGTVHLWDLKTNRELRKHKIGDDPCLALHKINCPTRCQLFLADDDASNSTNNELTKNHRIVITQTKNGSYKFWCESDTNEWTLLKTIELNYFGFCKSSVDYNNRFLICPTADSQIKLIYFDKKFTHDEPNVIKSITGGDTIGLCGEIMVVKLFEQFIVIVYESGVVKIWSLNLCKFVLICNLLSTTDCPMALDLRRVNNKSGDKITGYVGSNSDTISEFQIVIDGGESLEGNLMIGKRREVKITNPGVSCIKIREDCKLFAVGCWDRCIRLFSCKSLKLLIVLDHHKEIVQDLFFFPHRPKELISSNMAVASLDGTISLWHLY